MIPFNYYGPIQSERAVQSNEGQTRNAGAGSVPGGGCGRPPSPAGAILERAREEKREREGKGEGGSERGRERERKRGMQRTAPHAV
jgi:hypothetical protein